MKILIDINHPGHVHLYKNFIKEMENKGHQIFVCVKDIPSAKYLLEKNNIKYIELGTKHDSLAGKFINQLQYDWKILKIVREHKIEFGIGSSINLPHVSRLSRMKSFIFDDDDSAVEPLFARFAHPFADYIFSPDVLKHERNGKKHITYAGYHELAYLHPNRFCPDPTVLQEIGLKQGDRFFILRFNAFKAHHDLGNKGLSLETKRALIQLLTKKAKVLITMERELETEFTHYKLKVSAEKIHSLLYYATMLIGDSQTMTTEAAILGTPAIRSNSFVGRILLLEEEEKRYGLTYGFLPEDSDRMILKINELLCMSNLKAEWQKRRQKMLDDKIDVTGFMVWFFENYPESYRIMKTDPDYQYKFR